MVPWVERPTIEVDLDKPLAKRFDSVPPEAIEAGRRLLAGVMAQVPAAARWLAYGVRIRTANRFQAETPALARLVQADWREVLLANTSYDLTLAFLGCSTVALPTPHGPVLARNMDWWPEDLLAQASYILRFGRRDKLQLASAGFPGAVGVVTGLSGQGFAVALNAVLSPDGSDRTGYPVLLFLRRVLEDAPDFDAALAMISQQHLAAPALITLVGNTNQQRVVIERTCRRSMLRWPHSDEPLVATNDYRAMFPPSESAGAEIYQTTCHRYTALCQFFSQHRPDRLVDDAELLYILTDPSIVQTITAQHVLIRPRQLSIRLFTPTRLMQEST